MFLLFSGFLIALASYGYDASGGFLGAGDLAHGIMEGQAEHLDVEVNGVASQIALGPAPVTVFDGETGIGGHGKIVRLAYDELESALLEQWRQRGQPGGADLFA